jgi:hypothetical protein
MERWGALMFKGSDCRQICVFLLVVAGRLCAAQYEPLRLDPQNPHYLNFRGKPIVLVTSGEHYGALMNLDFNYSIYLKELQRDHLNLTRVFAGSYREIDKPHDAVKGGYTIDRNTLAPKPSRFVSPWNSAVQADGTVKFDLHHWNPRYFERLHDLLRQAGKRGVVVELSLFCLMYDQSLWEASPLNSRNNGSQTEDVPNTEVYNLRHPRLQEAEDDLVRKLVAETRQFDNLYFEVINEPYWHSVTPQWQRHITSEIKEAEGGSGVKHLISQNYANFSEPVKDPDPNVSLFNFHYSRPPESVAMNYELQRAIGLNETGFDGSTDAAYRIQGWDFLSAGGALYNNLDYSFAVGYERGTFQYPAYTPGGGGGTLRTQLGYLAEFFNSFNLPPMSPLSSVIVGGDLGGASARALGEAGKQYAIYLHRGRVAQDQKPQYQVDNQPHTARLLLHLPQRNYRYTWVDPKTGQAVSQGVFAQVGETQELQSPEYREDIALRILAGRE